MARKKGTIDWQGIADEYAHDAHAKRFEAKRGVWFLDDLEVLCVYNNNPYPGRDTETAELCRRLKEAGIEMLAYSLYPPEGAERAGYTSVMLLDAGKDRTTFVAETLRDVLKWLKEVAAKKGG